MMGIEKTQSVLFAGVSGQARLHEKIGNPETRRAVGRCLKRVQRAVDAHGGRTLRTSGDELIAVFALADDAFHAARDMQQRVADLPPVSGVKLAIGVGFAHGPRGEDEADLADATVKIAAALVRLAKPGQILTCADAYAALSPSLQQATRDLPASDKAPTMRIREVVAAGTAAPGPIAASEPADTAHDGEAKGARLRLRYRGEAVILDAAQPAIRFGRGAENTVVITDRQASRNHATIERRDGQIFVIDTSTNGTYVTFSGKPGMVLRRKECVIHGTGLIYFASSAAGSQADCALFEEF